MKGVFTKYVEIHVYEQSHFSNPLRSKQLSKGGAELRAVVSH